MKTIDIYDVKLKNKQAGKHFFDPLTMRAWRSRTSQTAYMSNDGRMFFVTSEIDSHGDCPRCYTVRVMDADGVVTNVSKFNQYSTSAQANKEAQRRAQEVK